MVSNNRFHKKQFTSGVTRLLGTYLELSNLKIELNIIFMTSELPYMKK